jgi:hypothetical protein
MALHWDLTAIEDHKTICWEHRENGQDGPGEYMSDITNGFIWATMSVGLGEITEENYEEFYRRLIALSLVNGKPLRYGGDTPDRDYTLAEVRAHIGLKCNVSNINALAFTFRLGRNVSENAHYKLKAALDKAQADAAEQVVEDASKGD